VTSTVRTYKELNDRRALTDRRRHLESDTSTLHRERNLNGRVQPRLVKFRPHHVDRIEAWFDDAETQRWLGGRDWIRRAPSLLTPTIGDEFRGKTVTARMMWVGLDEADELVSFVDGETYDRYAAWDGSTGTILWSPMSLRFRPWVWPSSSTRGAVDRLRIDNAPGRDRAARDVGCEAVLRQRRGGNAASIACVRRAGFRLRSPRPVFEGMLHFSFER
jgi:hypothetical protein